MDVYEIRAYMNYSVQVKIIAMRRWLKGTEIYSGIMDEIPQEYWKYYIHFLDIKDNCLWIYIATGPLDET